MHHGAPHYYKGYAGGVVISLCPELALCVHTVIPVGERLLLVRAVCRDFDITMGGFYSFLSRSTRANNATLRARAWTDLRNAVAALPARTTLILCMDANTPGRRGGPGFGPCGPHPRGPDPDDLNIEDLCDTNRALQLELVNTHRVLHGASWGDRLTGQTSRTNWGWSRLDYIAVRDRDLRHVRLMVVGEDGWPLQAPVDHLQLRMVIDARSATHFRTPVPPTLGCARLCPTKLRDTVLVRAFRTELRARLAPHVMEQQARTACGLHAMMEETLQDVASQFFAMPSGARPPHPLKLDWDRDMDDAARRAFEEYWAAEARVIGHTRRCALACATPAGPACPRCETLLADLRLYRHRRKLATRRLRRKLVEQTVDRIVKAAQEHRTGDMHAAAATLFARRPGAGTARCAVPDPDAVVAHLALPPREGFERAGVPLAQEMQDELEHAAQIPREERAAREEVIAELDTGAVEAAYAATPWKKAVKRGTTPSAVLRVAAPIIAPLAVLMFTMIISHGWWPQAARDASMALLPKATRATSDDALDAFRVICLLARLFLPLMSQLARTVKTQILTHREEFATQFGFLPGSSCLHALMLLHTICARAHAAGACVIVFLIDLRKAFDSIPREELDSALRAVEVAHGWRLVATDGLGTGLAGRHGETAYELHTPQGVRRVVVPYGVRQGSIEGPILFLILYSLAMTRARARWAAMNIPLIHVHSDLGDTDLTFDLFADDLTGMLLRITVLQFVVLLQELVRTFREFHLEFAFPKCSFLLIQAGVGARAWAAAWPAVGQGLPGFPEIKRVAHAPVLGGSISAGDPQASVGYELKRRRARTLVAFDRMGRRLTGSSILSRRLKIELLQAYVLSIMLYAVPALGPISEAEGRKLEGVQGRMLRRMFPKKKASPSPSTRGPARRGAPDRPGLPLNVGSPPASGARQGPPQRVVPVLDTDLHQEALLGLLKRVRMPSIEARIRLARLRFAASWERWPASLRAVVMHPILPFEAAQTEVTHRGAMVAIMQVFCALRGELGCGSPIPDGPNLLHELGAPASSPPEHPLEWMEWHAHLSPGAHRRISRALLESPVVLAPPPPCALLACWTCSRLCRGWRGLTQHRRMSRRCADGVVQPTLRLDVALKSLPLSLPGARPERWAADAQPGATLGCPVCGHAMLKISRMASAADKKKARAVLSTHLRHSWKVRGVRVHSPCGPALEKWCRDHLSLAAWGLSDAAQRAMPCLEPSAAIVSKAAIKLAVNRTRAREALAKAQRESASELAYRIAHPQGAKRAEGGGITPWLGA